MSMPNTDMRQNTLGAGVNARRRVGASEISIGLREEIVVDRESEKEVYEGELFRLRKDNECLKEHCRSGALTTAGGAPIVAT